MKNITASCLFLISIATLVSRATAQIALTEQQASSTVQSMASDADVMALGLLYGYTPPQTVTYDATLTSTGWTSTQQGGPTLFGTFLGQSLSVIYNGNTSAYPSGPITWTSTGAYGPNAWNGTGSATITSNSSTDFTIEIVYAVTTGPDGVSFDYVVPGTIDSSGNISFNGEVGTGTGTYVVGGKIFPLPIIKFSLKFTGLFPPMWASDIRILLWGINNTCKFSFPRLLCSISASGPGVATPTLPQWAAIVMALGLISFSVWEIRHSRVSTVV